MVTTKAIYCSFISVVVFGMAFPEPPGWAEVTNQVIGVLGGMEPIKTRLLMANNGGIKGPGF